MTEDIYQIFYSPETKAICFPEFFTLYNNTDKLTPDFENGVIRALYDAGALDKSEYFGVLSPIYYKKSKIAPAKIAEALTAKPDIVILQYGMGHPIRSGEKLHDGNHNGNFRRIIQAVLNAAKIRFSVDSQFSDNSLVWSNYIIAKSAIYKRYIEEFLLPCYAVMNSGQHFIKLPRERNQPIRAVLDRDARYSMRKNSDKTQFIEKQLGRKTWPLDAFILERLWPIFLEMNAVKEGWQVNRVKP